MFLTHEILDYAAKRPPIQRVPEMHKFPLLELCPEIDARPYQIDIAARGTRRSGFIVAPCAAGKTLIGLLIAVQNGGRILILTTRYADQWYRTISQMFSTIGNVIVTMLEHVDEHIDFPHVVVGTYAAFASNARTERQRIVRMLIFETIILDEAHGAASPSNLAMLERLNYRYAIALTATKVREDNELEKLEAQIGPTIVEVDRNMLVEAGYVANIECLNLIVPCGEFDTGDVDIPTRVRLAIDANKMRLLSNVLKVLSDEGHRIIVFCDDLFCLKWARSILNRSCRSIVGTISMATPEDDRKKLLNAFCNTDVATATLFISRTGDEALDLPIASAAIVFCNNWGSRRQLVQRLGRLARTGGKDPIFIVILADDEKEHAISKHRETYAQQYGFVFQTCMQNTSRYAISPSLDTSRYISALLEVWRSQRTKK